MTSRNLDTLRAEKAMQFIANIKLNKSVDAGEIRQEFEALPARLRMNGLLQTLVYLLNRDKKDRTEIGEEIIAYLYRRLGISLPLTEYGSTAVNICSNHNFRATEEALAYITWLKLMAKAELPKPDKEGMNDVTSE